MKLEELENRVAYLEGIMDHICISLSKSTLCDAELAAAMLSYVCAIQVMDENPGMSGEEIDQLAEERYKQIIEGDGDDPIKYISNNMLQ